VFNKEQKVKFIAASYPEEKSAEILELLSLFSPYEDEWHDDFLRQPISRLQPAFNVIAKTMPAKRAKALLSVVKKYREWFLSEYKEQAAYAGVLQLKISDDDKLRSSMVPSAMYLKLILDEVLEEPARDTVDNVYRALLWLAFAGVPRTLAPLITKDEIDFYNMVIRHDGREYRIPAEGLTEFQKLCELDTFLVIHKNPDYEKRRPRAEGNQLLRGLSNTCIEAEKIGDAIYQRFAKTKWSLTYEAVIDSGLYISKYEMERFGLDVSFETEIEQRLEAMTDQSKQAISNNRSMMRSRYTEKYNQWKNIFNLQTGD